MDQALSEYANSLAGPAKAKYREKIIVLGGIDHLLVTDDCAEEVSPAEATFGFYNQFFVGSKNLEN